MPPKKKIDKFQFKKQPIDTKARYKGQQIQAFRIAVEGRNASINSANEFITKTMKELFRQYKPTPNFTKVYRVLYKLSGGSWHSTAPLEAGSNPELFYPDMHDEQYNMNHNHELVEFINITMVNVPNGEVKKLTKIGNA
jgi:hypothetical protein